MAFISQGRLKRTLFLGEITSVLETSGEQSQGDCAGTHADTQHPLRPGGHSWMRSATMNWTPEPSPEDKEGTLVAEGSVEPG